jgi:hypothetical protein
MALSGSYDVIVVGGGSAGVAAAVGAAQAGAQALLIETYGFLGGAATHSLVLAWCGFYPQRPAERPEPMVAGVAGQVLANLTSLGVDIEPYYSATGNWNIRLNPEATKIALDRTTSIPGLDIALHTAVTAASVSGRTIDAVCIQDPRGLREIGGGCFVDASGDSALAFLAGSSHCPLRAPGKQMQPASYPVRITGVARGQMLDKAARARAMAQLERRLGRAELRLDGGIMTTLPGTDDIWWLAVEVETNGLDGEDLAVAEQEGRALAWRGVEALRRHVPGFERANVSATGPNIGIRETRHAATCEPLLEAALSEGLRRPDGVALGCWPMEIHSGPGRVEYRPIGGAGAYGIQLGALRSADFDNLWFGGRTVGADAAAYASVRVMGTAFATGHAAGVAAAFGRPDVSAIRAELTRQRAIV